MLFNHRALAIFFVLVLALSPLSGCQNRTARQASPPGAAGQSAAAAAQVTAARAPSASATAAPFPAAALPTAAPTAVPSPTATRVPLPPVVVQVTPAPGEEQPVDAPVVIEFDQAMDPASTAKAFRVEPAQAGQVAVQGQKLTFTPQGAFKRATEYRFVVADSAASAGGLKLAAPVAFKVNTAGYLQVAGVQPADTTSDVAVDTKLVVSFNRPVVPLTGFGEQTGLPQPLLITPTLSGKGEWLSTSLYEFTPAQGLAAATGYTVTVRAGLSGTTGAALARDFVWHFSTDRPTVLSWTPENSKNFRVEQPITVTFSMPMDRASTEAAFKLLNADRRAVPGKFTWKTQDTVMGFQPDRPLAFGARYVATLAATARAASGNGTLQGLPSNVYTTVGLPAIVRTDPRQGDQAADPGNSLMLEFAGPIALSSVVSSTVTILPKPAQVYTYYNEMDNQLYLNFAKQAATPYTVTVSGRVADPYGNRMGQDYVLRFRTRDYDPLLELSTAGGPVGTYNAYTKTEAVVIYQNVPRVDFGLYRVPLDVFLGLTGSDYYDAWNRYRPSPSALVRQWSVQTTAPHNQTALASTDLVDQNGRQLAEGLYFLDIRGTALPGRRSPGVQRQLLARSSLNVTFKSNDSSALAWVTDLKTGQPVPGAKVQITDGKKVNVTAATDGDGLASFAFPRRQNEWEQMVALATGPDGKLGVAANSWDQGLNQYNFNLPGGETARPYNAYVYTDRPIYRPGQTVYWKAVVREDNDARYRLPPVGQPVTATIRDDQGNKVQEQRLAFNAQGSVDGKLALGNEAGLGYYNVDLEVAKDQHYGVGFQVAEYRKPEYQITAGTDRPEYIQGDQIQAGVAAAYFFGGPVKNAKVRWVLLSSPYNFEYKSPQADASATTNQGPYTFGDWDWYDFERAQPYGGRLSEGTGVTDARGYFTVTVPADITKFTQSQRFTIDFTITDANNQAVAAQAGAVVHKGEFYIGLRPQSYVATAGQPSAFDVLTADTQSRGVPNTELTLVANRVDWYSVREQQEDGQYFWISKPRTTPVYTRTLTTGSDGKAFFTFTPDRGGQYKVEATGRDRAGHTLRGAAFVWVSSEEYALWRQDNNDRIQLIADKEEYQVGDTAQVLVTSPYQGKIKALLTLERNGVLSHEVIDLNGNSEVLRIPIRAEHAPNVFVALMLVKGMQPGDTPPAFKMGLARLKVSVADKQLQVQVTPDKASVGPRDTVSWNVMVRNAAGQPVSNTEVSLALVDKAILTLADDQAGTLMNRFYSQRALSVRTAASLVVNIDRVLAQLNRGAGKGGGGGGAAGMEALRSEFPDVAYWNATLTTGPDGQAQVKTALPDNLTTWVMDARAATADTLVGQSKTEIVASKELLVRPLLPRFFVQGDQAQIGATVHNNTSRELSVNIDMQGSGLKLAGAKAANPVTIPAQGSYTAAWSVTVTPGPGEPALLEQVKVQVRASGGGLSDAVEMTLPVYRYTTPEVTGTSGQVAADDQSLELVRLPANADPTRGELNVTLEPSLAAGMTGGLTYLTHYPYECVEQTLSRFLPNVVTYQALKSLGLDRPDLQPRLPQQVAVGLERLYEMQHVDGGWGWWQNDESSLFITSYVIFGLAKAQKAGFIVDENVMQRGVRFLQQRLAAPGTLKQPYELNQQAFMLYALALAGAPEPNRTGALYEARDRLSTYAQAYLALTLAQINDGASAGRIKTLLADITGKAVNSATTAHWEEGFVDYWNMNTDTRTTSLVLDALATLDPKHPLASNAVRWLMLARKADRWETTQENAWAIIALTDWMAATGELQGNYNWNVTLNGGPLGQGAVTPQKVGDVTQLVAEVGSLLGRETNAVAIERSTAPGQTGTGALYYTMRLKTYLPVEQIEPQSRGLTVSRVYQPAECGEAPLPAAAQPKGPGSEGQARENTCPPTNQARAGDVLNVKLTLVVPNTIYFLVVEDPLPAGIEAIDTSLKTTSQTSQGPQVQQAPVKGQKPYWWWSPTHIDLRDEKAVLFATEMGPGTYEFNYQVRATVPGQFLTLPPAAYAMYYPEVQGRGAGSVFTVQ